MAEWLVEEGIGEQRAALIRSGHIVAARIDWPGWLSAGQVEDAVLIARAAGSARGTARFANGEEALVSRLPREASEGARLRLEVTRAAMAEAGRLKRAQARPSKVAPRRAPTLAEALRGEGHSVRVVHAFPAGDWDDLVLEAATGTIAFAGGALQFTPTPAMTVIDIDGDKPPRELALAAVMPLAGALRRFDLGGNMAIDFPTLDAKADRQAVDAALAVALADWPHERTAINGFGLVQMVARLKRPSLLHRWAADPAGAAARHLLRRAERVTEAGILLLRAHPAVTAALGDDWRIELARRNGRQVRIESDPALAITGGFAQAVAS